MASKPKPIRLFLDTGVIIEGCTSRWGASKLVLILTMQRDLYTVVFAEAVEQELQRNVAYTVAPLPPNRGRFLTMARMG